MMQGDLRALPSVERLLQTEPLRSAAVNGPRALAVEAARRELERCRESVLAGNGGPPDAEQIATRAAESMERFARPSLGPVINATGVVVHTNLGRAPLAFEALEAIDSAASGYSNLEYDLSSGSRGSRQDHLAPLLRRLTGAEAAIVVNNNAAAMLLALAALAEGREVVVSRGELIEIGDGFRIPDVLARSGARLVEVGTTNRTRAGDYERAIGPETALLLRIHQSNFRVVGFAEQPRLDELAAVARRHRLPLLDDLGSGALVDIEGEPTPAAALAAGADLVCFSGDKLLGGPQAGIVAGRADLVEKLRRHPLHRALRSDKLTLAALEGTLGLYLDRPDEIPVVRMLREPAEAVRGRAERLAAATGGAIPSSGRCAPTSSRSLPSRGLSRCTSIPTGHDARFPCCACSRSPPTPFGQGQNAWPQPPAGRSRRPSRASAAARCRSRSCRASPAQSRRSWPRPCASTSLR